MLVQDVRVIQVIARDRADAIRAKKFILVQHSTENSAQAVAVHYRENPAISVAQVARSSGMNTIEQMRCAVQEVQNVLHEPRHAFASLRFNQSRRAQREQSND